MIHHLARAFALRQELSPAASASVSALNETGGPTRPSSPSPVRPRPITPWGGQPRGASARRAAPSLRISADPQDARRTVITGRFAEVCAALERLVLEQEAAA